MHIIPVMPTRGFPWHAPLFWVSWHFYPMDSGPLSAAAQSSMHLMIVFFSFAEILLSRGEIRSDRSLLGARSHKIMKKQWLSLAFSP